MGTWGEFAAQGLGAGWGWSWLSQLDNAGLARIHMNTEWWVPRCPCLHRRVGCPPPTWGQGSGAEHSQVYNGLSWFVSCLSGAPSRELGSFPSDPPPQADPTGLRTAPLPLPHLQRSKEGGLRSAPLQSLHPQNCSCQALCCPPGTGLRQVREEASSVVLLAGFSAKQLG